MSNIQISIEDFPEATIIMAKNGKIRASNSIATKRFGDKGEIGKFAPWLENSHGWNIRESDNGEIIGTFRPDADETARAKTMLFATLSHEIRTPLNGILGMAGLLGLSELNPAQRSYPVSYTHLDVYKRQLPSRCFLAMLIWKIKVNANYKFVQLKLQISRSFSLTNNFNKVFGC